jgi:hypothetical protein
MTAEHDKELSAALKKVEAHGWFVARITKSGYRQMRCACGQHTETLHKSPSNPQHFRQKANRMVRVCSPEVS